MKKLDTVNTFNEGLIMDLNPLVTPNNVLVNCLNGTITTFNGNENVLLNDMGNGRVETAYLPEGYIPLGTAELGGIVYVVSYNPLTNTSLIGSFPSPERNFSSEEQGNPSIDFTPAFKTESPENNSINSPTLRILLTKNTISPGDKFKITVDEEGFNTIIKESTSAYNKEENGQFTNNIRDINKYPLYIKFFVASIQEDGKILDLTDSLVWDNNYYLYKRQQSSDSGQTVDENDAVFSNGFSTFQSKTPGNLGILVLYEAITNFDCSWEARRSENNNWNLHFYTNWEYDNNQSKDKINLYGLKVVVKEINNSESVSIPPIIINNYKYKTDDGNTKGNTDILNKPYNVNFFSPASAIIGLEQEFKNEIRKNDGTDEPYLLPENNSSTHIELKENTKYEVKVYPMMPYGYLEYLKKSFTIDTSLLGSGNITFKSFRYFKEINKMKINWGIEAYPEPGLKIESVVVRCSDYLADLKLSDNDIKLLNGLETSTSKIQRNDYNELFRENNVGSGEWTNEILFEGATIGKDGLYLLEFEVNYTGKKEPIRWYRLMYTSDIFNSYYNSEPDFKDICFLDIIDKRKLDLNFEFSSVPNNSNKKPLNIESNKIVSKDDTNEIITLYDEYTYINKGTINPVYSLPSPLSIEVNSYKLNSITKSNYENSFNYDDTLLNSDPLSDKPIVDSILSLDSNNITIENTVKIPIKLVYSGNLEKKASFELTPLTSVDKGLVFFNRQKGAALFVCNYDENMSGEDGTNSAGDSCNLNGDISYFSNVKEYLLGLLSLYDIVLLLIIPRSYNGARIERGMRITGTTSYINGLTSGLTLIIYAIKSNNGVMLFTFNPKLGIQEKLFHSKYWGGFELKPHKNTYEFITNEHEEFLKPPSSIPNLSSIFAGYNKVIRCNDTVYVKSLKSLASYRNVQITLKFDVTAEITGSVKYSDTYLESKPDIPNLKYSSKMLSSEEPQQLISNTFIDNPNYILSLSNQDLSKILKTKNGFKSALDLELYDICDDSGEKIIYLKVPTYKDGTYLSYPDNNNFTTVRIGNNFVLETEPLKSMEYYIWGEGQLVWLKNIKYVE